MYTLLELNDWRINTQFGTRGWCKHTYKTKHSKSDVDREMAEEAKKIRATAKSRFTRKRKEFLNSVTENKRIDTVKRTFPELNEAWNLVEGKHDIY